MDWLDIARQWGGPSALAAVVGWSVGRWRSSRAASAKEREEQRLQGKAVRYLLDAQRQALHALVVLTGAEGRATAEVFDLTQLVRHRELVGMLTDEFWVHDGHPSDRARRRGDVDKWMTRTQAIKVRTQRLPPATETFKDGWRGDDIK